MRLYTAILYLAIGYNLLGCTKHIEATGGPIEHDYASCATNADCEPSTEPCTANLCFGGICTLADLTNPRIALPVDQSTGKTIGEECREPWSCSDNCPPPNASPCLSYACEGPNGDICVGRSVPDGTSCGNGKCIAGFCH